MKSFLITTITLPKKFVSIASNISFLESLIVAPAIHAFIRWIITVYGRKHASDMLIKKHSTYFAFTCQ